MTIEVGQSYLLFCVLAGANHSISYVGTFFASSLLSAPLASATLGTLWLGNAIAGLLFAVRFQKNLGLRAGLYLSFAGFAIQMAGLWVALVWPNYGLMAPVCSGIAGVTSAIWWNCQSLVVETHCQRVFSLVKSSQTRLNEVSAHPDPIVVRSTFNQVWTFIYQFVNVLIFLSLSLFQYFKLADIAQLIGLLSVIGVVSTLLLVFVTPGLDHHPPKPPSENPGTGESLGLLDVGRLLVSDPRAALLAPFQIAFSVSISLLGFYVNGNQVYSFDNQQPDGLFLGLFEAWGYVFSAFSAYPYNWIIRRWGSKGSNLVMQFGAACFSLCGIICLWFLPKGVSATWPVLLSIKAIFGLGRGVFEGENRSIFINLFAGPKLVTALCLQGALTGLAGGVSFLAADVVSEDQAAIICVAVGVLSLLSFSCLALNLELRRDPGRVIEPTAENYGKFDDSSWTWSELYIGLCGIRFSETFVYRTREEYLLLQDE